MTALCEAPLVLHGVEHRCLQPKGHDGWHSIGLLGDAATQPERPVALLQWEQVAA